MDENESLNIEELIESGELAQAQKALDETQKCARKYYLQGKLFMAKCWFTEARRQYKKAVKAEPANAEYNQALNDLEAFRKSEEYKTVKKQMGGEGGFKEACCLCSCEACGLGLCDAICNGCG